MKMRRLKKLTAVILTIIMLSSCAPTANKGSGSSNIANGEENKPSISSAASIETNAENVSSSPKNGEDGEKEEQNTSKQPSTDKENVSSEVKSPITPDRPNQETSSEIASSEESASNTIPNDPILRKKYVMLPDNPSPVTVHREKAFTLVPISHTDTLQDGEKIAFEANISNKMGSSEKDRYIAIFKTFDEFNPSYSTSTQKYNQDFFKNKALILLYVIDGCTNAGLEIKSVTQKNGQMCIHLKNTHSGGGYAVSTSKIYIEISKQDLNNINNIVVYEEKIDSKLENETIYTPETIYRDKIYRV